MNQTSDEQTSDETRSGEEEEEEEEEEGGESRDRENEQKRSYRWIKRQGKKEKGRERERERERENCRENLVTKSFRRQCDGSIVAILHSNLEILRCMINYCLVWYFFPVSEFR